MFWLVLRQEKTVFWLFGGFLSLILFAYCLTKVDVEFAGRAYAAYGGIYILASVSWLWLVERQTPDRWDLLGTTVCLLGTFIILFGKR